jgi:predicted DNA-binding protein (UPF0251 family)
MPNSLSIADAPGPISPEVEALKLVELEKLSFEEAATKMKVSRNTVWRLAERAREKLARAIIESKEIVIQQE